MECNKDDALRAKEIAERKFMERDYAGARRFVLKAQNLFPSLEGLLDMLGTLDVYISAENKICGEADWYGILGVNPWDDDEAVQKQYQKLILMLHPDNNKFLGAEGAFKLVLEAWSLLSDKSKRSAYNQKRNSRVVQQSTISMNSESNSHTNVASVPSQPRPRNDTFWTICNHCRTHYEYLRVYLNHTLLCPNCQQAFHAVEKAPPSHVSKLSNLHYGQSHRSSRRGVSNQKTDSSSRQQSSNFSMSTSSSTQRPGSLQHDQLKRRRAEYDYNQMHNYQTNQAGIGDRGTIEKDRGMGNHCHRFSKPNSEKDLSFYETRDMLMEKSRFEIRKMLSELRIGIKENSGDEKQIDCARYLPLAPSAINVPDSDFHNFDLDRTESFFEVDQVWAAYADGDGMPRFYARIQKVISLRPFEVQISWLNSRSTAEFSSQDWIGCGFTKTCGDFRAGQIEISRSLNSFSHRVTWMKASRGVIRIYPRRGEVWALYRNWANDWTELTPKEVVHKYEMVEVLEDFDEDLGILVSALVKVVGFRTVFHRHNPDVRWRIPKKEMLRFSHRIPSYLLTGQEAQNAPEGCWELDPAAMPIELLQVIAEV
ncbi:hypothetical protein SAY86_011448 [Trapa natans]|uniref:J domain-containing protein n=1 Tax=Trapa natans TaxID=22666 RepID=A0AAN7LUK3_TRANT|nr:hypothetical protein SAY86_011448 [Trapa natans]